MRPFRTRLRRLCVAGTLIGAVVSAGAAPGKAADKAADKDGPALARMQSDLARTFRLPQELPLDPDLRTEADSIAGVHLARINGLLPGWIAEERRLQAGEDVRTTDNTVYLAVWARLLNELALWQLEPGDAAYEKATLEALKTSPLACEIKAAPNVNDFAARILRIQAMPAAQRQTALANERRLLEHWAQPRPAIPAWPAPLPQDAAMTAVEKIRDGGARPALALSPVLAAELLGERTAYADLAWQSQCELKRWWLRVSLAQGASPEAALKEFRYATLIGVVERYRMDDGGADEGAPKAAAQGAAVQAPPYPDFAKNFDVSGVTRVSRSFDAAGKPVAASVIDRRIKVRGIRGVRPVAFETTFDALALHYALQGGDGGRPGAPLPPVFEMVWTLDSEKGNKQ